jgi:hypothetical protein
MNNIEIANAIRDTAQESILDIEVLESARKILAGLQQGADLDEIGSLLFNYSATLSAIVATQVAYVCLGNEKFDKMADAVMENEVNSFIEQIEKFGENN